jgi:hypothetical protein
MILSESSHKASSCRKQADRCIVDMEYGTFVS